MPITNKVNELSPGRNCFIGVYRRLNCSFWDKDFR